MSHTVIFICNEGVTSLFLKQLSLIACRETRRRRLTCTRNFHPSLSRSLCLSFFLSFSLTLSIANSNKRLIQINTILLHYISVSDLLTNANEPSLTKMSIICKYSKCIFFDSPTFPLLYKVTMRPLFLGHVLAGISKLPNRSRFWLGFLLFSYLLKVMTEK